jgi:competence protein ComEC
LRDPLLVPLAAMAGGILAARYLEFDSRELVAALAALCLLACIARAWCRRPVALACALAACVILGAWSGEAHRPGPPPQLDAAPGEVVTLEGCVVEPPAFFEDRERFVVELAPGARVRADIRLAEGEPPPRFEYGQRIEFEARVAAPRNFGNPGAFDFAGYLARQQIFWTAAVARPPGPRVLAGGCGSRIEAAVFALRSAALERLERLYPADTYNQAMMKAILIGDNTRMEKVWTEVYRRTGTYHALVISGLHVAVLAGVLLFLLRVCAVPELASLGITAAAAWLYAAVAGWQAPVVRSAAGFSVYLAARFFYRRARILNTLAAVAIGFLLFDPAQAFEASFQLSFLAVAAIGALAAPLLEATSSPLARGLAGLAETDRDLHLEPRVAQFRVELRLLAETLALAMRAPLAWCRWGLELPLRAIFFAFELAVISATVQAGLALPLVVYFHRLSLSGVSANLLIVPLMSAVVPAGFLAIFTGWSAAAWFARLLLDFSRAVAEWHARLEPAWRVPPPPAWLGVALAAALLVVAWTVTLRSRRWPLRLGLAALAALLAVLVAHPFAPRLARNSLELTAIDVGQAESLLVATPEGKTVLVDGGGFPEWSRRKSRLDIGEDVVSPYLWSRSIRRLDAVACSHAHSDHIGGLEAVLRNFRPGELWTSPVAGGPDWEALRARAVALGIPIVVRGAGERFRFGGAEFEVLAPPAGGRPSPAPHNNDSLVLRVRHGAHSFLLTGDVERVVERRLLDEGRLQPTDVLKVAHHGSRTSSSPGFLEAVHPAFAVISAGYLNPYRFPHPDVVARLAGLPAAVYRTDRFGFVTIRTDGRRFEVETLRDSPARPGLLQPF